MYLRFYTSQLTWHRIDVIASAIRFTFAYLLTFYDEQTKVILVYFYLYVIH